MLANNICAYVDTALVGQMNVWNLNGVKDHVITYDGRLDGNKNAKLTEDNLI
jgi:hypothetical protein